MSDHQEEPSNNANKLLIEALTKKLETMMNEKISSLCEEIILVLADAISYPQRNEQVRNEEGNLNQARQQEAEDYYSNSSHSSQRRQQRVRDDRIQQQDSFGSLKLRIPQFQGKNDLNAYMEWEKKIEMVFDCQFYTEANRVKVAATEFCDYALCW
ncbi:hypothetical protein V5N11_020194 [Cardamine amara subsp. amara]|uniref:Uncharacterized protein n=1 Tax=Cardamine amara subsp. amara TaxID=228776 RepID=A0ABD1C582_CARAN